MSEKARSPQRDPIQLTLPFTDVVEGANCVMEFVQTPQQATSVQYWLDRYLDKEFGMPRPESSEE